MPPDNTSHEEIKKLLVENQRLLLENNQMLHKMRRISILGTFFRILWFIIVISIPLAIYFFYIQPNMGSIKEKINSFEQMSSDTSTLKEWYESVKKQE